MKGFRPPEYTQTPNKFFDELLPELGYAELKVLLCLFRQTFGWHRPTVKMSVKKIAKATGLSAHHAFDAGVSLEKRELIRKVITLGESTEWEVLFEGITLGDMGVSPTGERGIHPSQSKPRVKEIKEREIKKNEDDAIATISKAYHSEIGIITPMIREEILEACDAYPLQWTLDAIHEAAVQNKRGWKYILAILTRWKAQGNQEEIKRPQTGGNYKPRDLLKERYGGIMDWLKEADNDNTTTNGSIDGADRGSVPQLQARQDDHAIIL